jgi:hypothetical protein
VSIDLKLFILQDTEIFSQTVFKPIFEVYSPMEISRMYMRYSK